MGTWMCPARCDELCKAYVTPYTVEQLTYRYALSSAEKILIAKYPEEAISVLMAKQEASKSTGRIFGVSGHNDESDAFRHYVWSGLIANEIGAEKARLFLDAHERNPDQPAPEKEMDSYNNSRGIAEAEKLGSKHSFSIETLEKSALQALQEAKLKVLRPQGRIPQWK